MGQRPTEQLDRAGIDAAAAAPPSRRAPSAARRPSAPARRPRTPRPPSRAVPGRVPGRAPRRAAATARATRGARAGVGVVERRGQDRGDAEGEQVAAALARQPVEHLDQRQVAAGPGLVQPLLADRPGAVPGQPGQVAVQDDAERPDGWRSPAYGGEDEVEAAVEVAVVEVEVGRGDRRRRGPAGRRRAGPAPSSPGRRRGRRAARRRRPAAGRAAAPAPGRPSRCPPTSRASSAASSSRLWNGLPGGKVRRFGVVTTSRPPGRSTRAHSRTNGPGPTGARRPGCSTTRPAHPSREGEATRGSRGPAGRRGRCRRRGAGTAGRGRARRPGRPRPRPAADRRTPRRSRPRPPPRRGPAATSPPTGTPRGAAGTSSSRARSRAASAHRSARGTSGIVRRRHGCGTALCRAAGRPANHEPRGQAWMASVTSARRSWS